MSRPWSLHRGATRRGDCARFEVWAPVTKAAEVHCSVNGDPVRIAMVRDDRGVFTGEIEGLTAHSRIQYQYCLDRGGPLPDPVSCYQPHGVHGPSVAVDPATFDWSDAGWPGLSMADLIIYELHVGTFTPTGSFAPAGGWALRFTADDERFGGADRVARRITLPPMGESRFLLPPETSALYEWEGV